LKNLQLATWKLLVVSFVFDMYCNYSCSEFVQRQNRLSVVTSLFPDTNLSVDFTVW